MCKYGAKCYQKGAEHRSKFAHPVLPEEEGEGKGKVQVSGEIGNVRWEGGWELKCHHMYRGDILVGEILSNKFTIRIGRTF